MDLLTDTVLCESQLGCNPCVTLSYCMFVILIGGKEICMHKNEVESQYTKAILETRENFFLLNPANASVSDTKEDWALSIQKNIKENTLRNYNTEENPISLTGNPAVVHTRIDVNSFTLDELSSTFHVNGQLYFNWNDDRLAWPENTVKIIRAESYRRLSYKQTEIWWPKITVENEGRRRRLTGPGSSSPNVDHLGNVNWDVPAKLSSECQLNLLRWPFDSQNCSITLTMDLLRNRNAIGMQQLLNDSTFNDLISFENWGHYSDWIILKYGTGRIIDCQDPTCSKPNVQVVFWFTILRNLHYSTFVVLPLVYIALCHSFDILADPPREVKVVTGAINFLFLAAIIVYSSTVLPLFFSSGRLLYFLYLWNLTWIVFSLTNSLFVLLWRPIRDPPESLQRLFLTNNFDIPGEAKHLLYNYSWEHLTYAFDRFIFLVFSTVSVLTVFFYIWE